MIVYECSDMGLTTVPSGSPNVFNDLPVQIKGKWWNFQEYDKFVRENERCKFLFGSSMSFRFCTLAFFFSFSAKYLYFDKHGSWTTTISHTTIWSHYVSFLLQYGGAYDMLSDLEKMNLTPTASMYNAIMVGFFREVTFFDLWDPFYVPLCGLLLSSSFVKLSGLLMPIYCSLSAVYDVS